MSNSPPEILLQDGVRRHRAGNLQEAEAIYRRILGQKPDHHQALHLVGIIALQRKEVAAAIATIRRAIAIEPRAWIYHHNLGKALVEDGQIRASIAAFRDARGLGGVSVELHNDLGNALCREGKYSEAIEIYRRCLERNPRAAIVHNNLGNALLATGQLEAGIAAYRWALKIRPDYADAAFNLGNGLYNARRWKEAAEAYRRAMTLNPRGTQARLNLANTLLADDAMEEAAAEYRRVIELDPRSAEAHNNLGTALKSLGQLEGAIEGYREAIRINPDYVMAHMNLGMALLLKGNLEEGWEEYEWRSKVKDYSPPWALGKPRFDGKAKEGQTVLLTAEQGFGETIQFVRFATMAVQRRAQVIVQCQADLVRLLQSNPELGRVISFTAGEPAFDVCCPLVSLARVFRTRLDSIPAPIPYLFAEKDLVESWKQKLGDRDGSLRIGLAWAGNPLFKDDRMRSMGLEQLAGLGTVQGVQFYSLQKGAAGEHAKNPPAGLDLIDLGPELKDFADTAAVMSLMDLIISTDTSIPHLAGALGRPVWLMLQFVPDFRWLLDGKDSPWYPTMRLFRQKSAGDWAGVVSRVTEALVDLRNQHPVKF
jgi:tetratricopeptide (TPR) repeat protein